MIKTTFTSKQLDEMSSQNLAYLILSFAKMCNKTFTINEDELEELCRISRKDKRTKQKLVAMATEWQYRYNGMPVDISALRKFDTSNSDDYLEIIIKQSLDRLFELIPYYTIAELNPDNYHSIVMSVLTRDKNYKSFELYSRYLPNPAMFGFDAWKKTIVVLDKVFKDVIFSNADYINYLISVNEEK